MLFRVAALVRGKIFGVTGGDVTLKIMGNGV